jgi:hypothetical protein
LELVGLAESRASQIQTLVREKHDLLRELDQRQIQLGAIRVSNELEKELRYQLSMQEPLKGDLNRALREVESLQNQRRSYLEEITVLSVMLSL